MYITIEIATALLEMLVLSIYLKGLYQTYAKSPALIWVSYTVAGVLLCLLSIYPVNPFIRLGYAFLSFFILARLLFDAKWLHAVYSALLLCAINMLVDTIISNIIGLFGISVDTLYVYGNNRIFYIAISKLIQFFFIFLVVKVSTWKRSRESLVDAVPLLLCQFFSIFICYFMYLGALKTAADITASFIVCAAGILYINIIIFLYVERVKRIGEIKRENALAEQQYRSKLEYFEQVRDDQQETRALWHDIRKYLNTMNELMSRNDITHARECIGQVSELFAGIGQVVDVGNTVVSAVLNHSIQKARHMDIDTDLDVRVHPDLTVSAADLSVIIGNTFDNAIEACAAVEGKKTITVSLIEKNAMLFYEITNPRDPSAVPAKKDAKMHGFGLKNVKRCVDKYRGAILTESDGATFKVSVHLNLPAEGPGAQLVS